MKTIEEKAKAYDKALERAQALYNDKNEIGYANAESILEEVFPLLKESEDERIRKFLIKWIQNNYYHGTTEIPTKTLIAWLEKQGEKSQRMVSAEAKEAMYSKPAWSEEDERSKNAAIRACKYMIDNFENSTKQYDDAITWLKSLKQRIGG